MRCKILLGMWATPVLQFLFGYSPETTLLMAIGATLACAYEIVFKRWFP